MWLRRSIEPRAQAELQQQADWLTTRAVIARLALDQISARPQLLAQRMLNDWHARGIVERRPGLSTCAGPRPFEYRWKRS